MRATTEMTWRNGPGPSVWVATTGVPAGQVHRAWRHYLCKPRLRRCPARRVLYVHERKVARHGPRLCRGVHRNKLMQWQLERWEGLDALVDMRQDLEHLCRQRGKGTVVEVIRFPCDHAVPIGGTCRLTPLSLSGLAAEPGTASVSVPAQWNVAAHWNGLQQLGSPRPAAASCLA
jgi:hypothetical protein